MRLFANDRVVAMILEGALREGDPLPSVRQVAAEFRLNPITVLKGYQQLVDEALVEKRRGRGMFVSVGASSALPSPRRKRRRSGRSENEKRNIKPTGRKGKNC